MFRRKIICSCIVVTFVIFNNAHAARIKILREMIFCLGSFFEMSKWFKFLPRPFRPIFFQPRPGLNGLCYWIPPWQGWWVEIKSLSYCANIYVISVSHEPSYLTIYLSNLFQKANRLHFHIISITHIPQINRKKLVHNDIIFVYWNKNVGGGHTV